MPDRPTPARLYARANMVASLLDSLPSLHLPYGATTADSMAAHRRFREASSEIADDLRTCRAWPARITETPDGARVTMLGITTSSTSGIAAALRAWTAKARAKAEAMETAHG